MENATKALLIAAAVLISIAVITIGLIVFRMASGAISDVNMSEAEITSFNEKFNGFEGSRVSGSKVNAMLKTVLQHNTMNTDAGRQVAITGDIALATNATSLPSVMADTGKTYTVKCTIGSAGYVTSITVTLNK